MKTQSTQRFAKSHIDHSRPKEIFLQSDHFRATTRWSNDPRKCKFDLGTLDDVQRMGHQWISTTQLNGPLQRWRLTPQHLHQLLKLFCNFPLEVPVIEVGFHHQITVFTLFGGQHEANWKGLTMNAFFLQQFSHLLENQSMTKLFVLFLKGTAATSHKNKLPYVE